MVQPHHRWLIAAPIGLLAALGPASGASAQAYQCAPPDTLAPAAVMPRPASQPSRQAKVDGYTLALSWSPEYCRGRIAQPADRLQCSRAAGEFGFVITGLWPDAQRGAAPTWCTSSNRRLDAALVKKHFCAFASPERMERAWRRHGACTAMPPARYFAAATRAFAALAIPDMERLSRQPLTHERLIQA